MRFDSSLFWHHKGSVPWDQQSRDNREYAKALEALGFTTAWSCEHHLIHDMKNSCSPNALMTSLDLAHHTKTLRVGQAPYNIVDRHPLLVAEDVAVVDNLIDGRLDFGVGRGVDSVWSVQFSPYADRRNQEQNRAYFAECLEIIVKAWKEKAFTYKGQFFTIPVPGWKEVDPDVTIELPFYNSDGEYVAVGVMPKPIQKPHPPVFVMMSSPQSYAFAGEHGYRALGSSRSPEGIREAFTVYQQAAVKAQGRAVPLGENCGVQFPTYCARTMEEAIRVTREHLSKGQSREKVGRDALGRRRQDMVGPDVKLTDDDLNLDRADFIMKFGLAMIGTPDVIAENIERYVKAANLDHYESYVAIWGSSFKQCMDSIELFGTQVMPRFQKTREKVTA